jgi:hypothetical protein
MVSDHAEEFFAQLRATEAAEAEELIQLPPWVKRPWIDHLAEVTVPVTTVVSAPGRVIGEAIARRALDAEIVVAAGQNGLAPADDRARAAEALLRMLDRID